MADAENQIPEGRHLPDPESPFFKAISRPDFDAMEMIREISWQQIKEELGQEIVEFQLLETQIKVAIGLLLHSKDPALGQLVTAQLDFNAKLGLLSALFAHRYPDSNLKSELHKILSDCDERRQARNRIVHSYWYNSEDGQHLNIRIPKSTVHKASTPDKSTALSTTLREESNKCSECSLRLRSFLEPLPDYAP
jgi:hypothetical protein